MEDGKRYAPDIPEEETRKEYEQQAEELLKRSGRDTQNPYEGQNGYGENYGRQQYGYDPNYGRQQYGYDPRYAQNGNGNGYDQQYGYNQNYGQQQYGYDPNYGQQQYGYDPNYGQQQYGYDPNYGRQQYGYDPNYGRQQYGYNQNYAPQQNDGYGEGYPEEEPAEHSRRRAGSLGDRIHESYDEDYDDDYDENDEEEEYEEEYDEEEDTEKPERHNRKKASGLKKLKKKLSKIPSKTLLLIGGGIVIVLIAAILLVALLPKGGESRPVEVAQTPTPEAEFTPEPTEEPTPEPTVTPHPITTPLNFGMESDVVAEIQERLIELGYMDYPVVDGVEQVTTMYGKTTKNAVRTFQSKNGLDTDGQCGQATYDVLMSDAAKGYFVSRGDEDTGENGPVRKMQKRLIELGFMTGSATGHCGDSTVVAVQKFQKANGLDADGKAGQQTLALMYSDDAIGKDGTKVPYTPPALAAVAEEKTEAAEATATPDASETEDDAE